MQYIEGKSLDLVITELRRWRGSASLEHAESNGSSELMSSHHGRPFYQSVARVGLQVAEAISYAHGEGILHRDIKPSNLLSDVKGCAWVTDFGLAKTEDSDGLTQTGDFVGTLRYMAPERLQGHSDRRSDLYSLGATLYELLTLRPFLEASGRGQLIDKILHDVPARPSKFDPDVPRDLETIILKAIARDPRARYQSAALIAEDLTRFLTDRPIKARRANLIEQFTRWCRRNPAVSALLALDSDGTVFIWEGFVAADPQLLTLASDFEPAIVALAPAGNFVALSEPEEQIRIVDLIPRDVGSLQFDQHSQWLAVAYGNTTVFDRDFASGFVISSIPEAKILHAFPTDTQISALSLSPDGNTLAAAGHNGNIWLCSTKNWIQPEVWVTVPGASFSSIVFSPDGRWLLTGSGSGEVQIRDLKTRQLHKTLNAHGERVSSMAISPDSQTLATCSWDRTVKLWHIPTFRELTTIPASHIWLYSVDFSPDGNSLAAGGVDSRLRLWDAAPLTQESRR